jgi:glycine/D-amino acid oxidase-like deaminating enzyme
MIFTADFKLAPYWWEKRETFTRADRDLPTAADVVVIGAGVTGVEAARILAEGGREVLVLDATIPGEGASSRNAGMIGRNFKHSYSGLKANYGQNVARAYFAEMQDAYNAVRDLGRANPDAFDWREDGRIIAAMSPTLFDKLRKEYELRAREIGEAVEVIDGDDMEEEIGSHCYCGGIRLPQNGAIQPARFHQFLMRRAIAAGAAIIGETAVVAVDRERTAFIVRTNRGAVACAQVMVATNGYSGRAIPTIRSRLLPINAFMIATEDLSENLVRAILPRLRTYHDNRRRSHFFSVSPNGKKILLGGRTGNLGLDLKALAAKLHGDLLHIFPELAGTRLSHAWRGRCAAPIDAFPRFGELDGLYYALGYSFSGMAMGPHLGRKAAWRMLGRPDAAQSHFARPDFPKVPWPARTPFTMPIVIGYYGWADRPPTLGRRM